MVKAHWDDEELIENWTLNPTELELVSKKVGANQIGFAILLKHFQTFARFPDSLEFRLTPTPAARLNGTVQILEP